LNPPPGRLPKPPGFAPDASLRGARGRSEKGFPVDLPKEDFFAPNDLPAGRSPAGRADLGPPVGRSFHGRRSFGPSDDSARGGREALNEPPGLPPNLPAGLLKPPAFAP
jgi:hypothetical protein